MVDPTDPWRVLGIAPTGDTRAIKKAYAARLKHAHPEDDAEAFQRLRQAYEMALAFARWQQTHKDVPRPPQAEGSTPAPELHPHPPRDSPPALRAVARGQKPGAAAALLARAEQLHDDPERRASQDAWRALLASESLWNVDVRAQFERGLIALILRRGCGFAPAVGCVLEQEFHWTEQALSLQRAFPGPAVDRLIERLEQAPLEFADELCQEGLYGQARALLEPIVNADQDGRPRIQAARRLLDRCADGETADRLIHEVERLRGDARAWVSVEDWRLLLNHKDLRSAEVRAAFQLRLIRFLAGRGEGLTGSVWRLLRKRCDWPAGLPKAVLARALPVIGTAIVEDVEQLCAEQRYQEVVSQWAEVILGLEGEAARRGRLALERCCLHAIARAQAFADQAQHRDVIDEIARVAAVATGDAGARARALLERSAGALLDLAQQLFEQKRYPAAIGELGPVVRRLEGTIGVKARLLLARCYFGEEAFGKAEHYLKEVLRADPHNVDALLQLGVVCQARESWDRAWEAYHRVLALRPGHAEAVRELETVERERRKAAAAEERAQAERVQPERAADRPPATLTGSPTSGLPWWSPLLLISALNSLRNCSSRGEGPSGEQLGVLLLIVVAIVAVAFGIHRWQQRHDAVTSLSPQPARGDKGRSRNVVLAILAGAIATALLVVWVRQTPSPAAPTPEAKAGRSLSQGLAALEAGNATRALPLLKAAAAENPRAADVFEAQGRALHRLGRSDEAMTAFTRQIEIEPRHPRAYAWRARLHMDAGRWDDADRELLKQIEIAPSIPWSYEQLARHRTMQGRTSDAMQLFSICARLEPKQARRWADLAWAQALASRPAEARASIDEAMSLAPEDWVAIEAARVYGRLGFAERAGEVARSALPSLQRRLNALRPDSFGEGDLYWTDALAYAWARIGEAAAARGDRDEASRYLEAGWRLSLSFGVGTALAELRERQGRVTEAESMRRAARHMLEGVGAPGPKLKPRDAATLGRLTSVRLEGPAVGVLEQAVLLLVDGDGRVQAVHPTPGPGGAEFKRQLEALGTLGLPPQGPDKEPLRVVRRATLRCSPASGCTLVLHPTWHSLPVKAGSETGFDAGIEVRIAKLDASEGLPLRPGSRIWLSATIRYSSRASEAELKLFVRDQPGRSLTELLSRKVESRRGAVTLEGSYVVPRHATGLDVEVRLLSAESHGTLRTATAWLAVAEPKRPGPIQETRSR